jgi:SAM-dependent methyltransferase
MAENLVPDLPWTGERFIPGVGPEIAYEHYGRYLFARQFCRGKRVIDIPSGEGFGSALLAEVARDVQGFDIAEAAVHHAQAKYGDANVSFAVGDMATFDRQASRPVDVVVCFEGIEHIDATSQSATLAAVSHVLADGGILVMSTPIKDVYSGQLHTDNPFHLHELSIDDLQNLIAPYFSHQYLFGQVVADACLIDPFRGHSKHSRRYFLDPTTSTVSAEAANPERFTYAVAVCSNQALDPACLEGLMTIDLDRGSMWRHRAEVQDGMEARFAAERETLQARVAETTTAVTSANARTVVVEQELHQVQAQRQQFADEVAAKAAKIAVLEQQLQGQSAELGSLQVQLQDQSAELGLLRMQYNRKISRAGRLVADSLGRLRPGRQK